VSAWRLRAFSISAEEGGVPPRTGICATRARPHPQRTGPGSRSHRAPPTGPRNLPRTPGSARAR
jgi:hypothetical protein